MEGVGTYYAVFFFSLRELASADEADASKDIAVTEVGDVLYMKLDKGEVVDVNDDDPSRMYLELLLTMCCSQNADKLSSYVLGLRSVTQFTDTLSLHGVRHSSSLFNAARRSQSNQSIAVEKRSRYMIFRTRKARLCNTLGWKRGHVITAFRLAGAPLKNPSPYRLRVIRTATRAPTSRISSQLQTATRAVYYPFLWRI